METEWRGLCPVLPLPVPLHPGNHHPCPRAPFKYSKAAKPLCQHPQMFGSVTGAEAWDARPPFRGWNRAGNAHGVAVTVTLTGASSLASAGVETGSRGAGRAPSATKWVLGHQSGWLSPWLTPWVLLPAAAPGAAGAAPSSVAVSASSGVPAGSWSLGPALEQRTSGGLTALGAGAMGQRHGVWALTCGRAGCAALGTDRHEVCAPWSP